MMRIRYFVPSALSLCRLVLACFLFIPPLSVPVILVFVVLAGVSDFLDGFLARRWNCTSPMGALLDSGADLVFFAALIYRVVLQGASWEPFTLVLIGAVIGLRIISAGVCFLKNRRIYFLHTVLNKITGGLCFTVFLLFLFFPRSGLWVPVLLVSLLASGEELALFLFRGDPGADSTGFFSGINCYKKG